MRYVAYIEMPKLSDTMTEGTLVKWRKVVGDKVEISDILAEVETDKAVMELESFERGILTEIYVNAGGKARIAKSWLCFGAGEVAPEREDDGFVEKPKRADVAKPVQTNNRQRRRSRHTIAVQTNCCFQRSRKSIAVGEKARGGQRRGAGNAARIRSRWAGHCARRGIGFRRFCLPRADGRGCRSADGGTATNASHFRACAKLSPIVCSSAKTQIPHFYLNIEVDAGELLRLRTKFNAHIGRGRREKTHHQRLRLESLGGGGSENSRVNASFAGDAIIEYADVHLLSRLRLRAA